MPKVYIVCEPIKSHSGAASMDLTPALAFGELEVLLQHTQSMLAPVPTVRSLLEKLENFGEDDYILPVGDPVLMSTVAMVAAKKNHGRVKFLKWDRRQGRYYVIQVDTSGAAQ